MSSRKKPDVNAVPIPKVLVDVDRKKKYELGKCLGKGGFAKCFEVLDTSTGQLLAGKIVPKALLQKDIQREKMTQEIMLHKRMVHQYVVRLISYFEDSNFVYIILELCSRRSMMELHRRRKAITEPEARYYMKQILLGVNYVHELKIIHRDLKLGNIFLNEDMKVKIGDFGLATELSFDGEKKKTLCGTPNYIAPEVLGKKGHGYEVDVWSLGCILFTLLVGKPPFETATLNDTYKRIRNNEYAIPSSVGSEARHLITRMLQHDPAKRPTVAEILADSFFTCGYLPTKLPVSCLTTAPRFTVNPKYKDDLGTQMVPPSNSAAMKAASSVSNPASSGLAIRGREPLTEVMATGSDNRANKKGTASGILGLAPNSVGKPTNSGRTATASLELDECKSHIHDLYKQLKDVIATNPTSKPPSMYEEAEDPKFGPVVWVSKWVDYSDKYGFGYALNDESIGVLFNDLTKLLLLSDGINVHYIDFEEREHYFTLQSFPPVLEKKVKLLNYFHNYMKEHLLKAGADMQVLRDGDELSRIPALKTWFRTSRAVVMHLTNGTVQINFFRDHTKIILCPLMGAVTYIDQDKKSQVFSFDLIKKYGCDAELNSRLAYAAEKVSSLIKSSCDSVPSTGLPTSTSSSTNTVPSKNTVHHPSKQQIINLE